MSTFGGRTPEMVRPVDPDVARLLDLLAKSEMAEEQQGVELGRAKLNRVLSTAGQLAVKPGGRELLGDLPGEVKNLITSADRRIRSGRALRTDDKDHLTFPPEGL